MNNLYTKSSADAKLTEDDIATFSKVCEKGINELTDRNTEFTEDFNLSQDLEYTYNLKKARVLKELQVNEFAKIAISDKFKLAVETIKNKVFLKCYQSEELILEISMSKKQLQALEDKYCYDLELFDGDVPQVKYHLFYAGTFMRTENNGVLKSKLVDLRLLKLVDTRDI